MRATRRARFVTNPNVPAALGLRPRLRTRTSTWGSETSETDAEVVVDAVLRELDGLAPRRPLLPLRAHHRPARPLRAPAAVRPALRRATDPARAIRRGDRLLGTPSSAGSPTISGRPDAGTTRSSSSSPITARSSSTTASATTGTRLFQESVRVPLVVKLRDGERGGGADRRAGLDRRRDADGARRGGAPGTGGHRRREPPAARARRRPRRRGRAAALRSHARVAGSDRRAAGGADRAAEVHPDGCVRSPPSCSTTSPPTRPSRPTASPPTPRRGRELSTVVDEHRSESAAGPARARRAPAPVSSAASSGSSSRPPGGFEDLGALAARGGRTAASSRPTPSALALPVSSRTSPRLLPGEVSVEPLDRDGIALRIDPPEAGLTIRSLESEGTRPLAVAPRRRGDGSRRRRLSPSMGAIPRAGGRRRGGCCSSPPASRASTWRWRARRSGGRRSPTTCAPASRRSATSSPTRRPPTRRAPRRPRSRPLIVLVVTARPRSPTSRA